MKPTVLIFCAASPLNDPRPNRMIQWLKDEYALTVVQGKGFDVGVIAVDDGQVEDAKSANIAVKIIARLMRVFLIVLRLYDAVLKLEDRFTQGAMTPLVREGIDLIIVHDLVLLPRAFSVARMGNTKVLFDAREYYPREFESQAWWRWFVQPFNRFLCERYLRRCDKIITVSQGIADEYRKEYGVHADVVMSFTSYADLQPQPPQTDAVRIIYHGQASPDRQIDRMVRMMDHLDERFSLDLMLVSPSKARRSYYRTIEQMVKGKLRVRILPPVPMKNIVEFTNPYDVGLFICPPTTFNLKFALPNKFFEFIQARLVVAIGPSVEMRRIVNEYDCGVVAESFEPRALADVLGKLDGAEIARYKNNSHRAAQELNAGKNAIRIQTMVRDMIHG